MALEKNEVERLKEVAEKLTRKIDISERFRKNILPNWKLLITVISIIFTLFSCIWPTFGRLQPMQLRGIHLGFVLALVFLYYPAREKSPQDRPSVLDIVFIMLSFAIGIYTWYNTIPLALRAGLAVPRDYVFGGITIFLVLESCRRVLGKQLLAICLILLAYAYFGNYIPGLLSHKGYSLTRIIYQMYLTTEGIFGLPLGISATYMVLFIALAAVLAQTGLGKLFNDVSIAIAGRKPGGPTKVATTGAFTIPLMKKIGYKPYFAGAVEAAASTGGQIMPPVMGTVAFLMAEFLGVPYIKIAAAALIPALL